ncbi:hypothetical protein [Fluviicola taffensis]|uniref:hypothetical protein n=1 Tax=Fluviicola taffensis TaxID=191579 RepID=UPI0031379FDE
MYRLLILLFLFHVSTAKSQRIFSATGILGSFLDMKATAPDGGSSSLFPGGIFKPSISLGFETNQWKRLSITAVVSNFSSGGKGTNQTYLGFSEILFNNTSLGLIGNYYIVNKKTQFYIGLGPRLDYIRSERDVYKELNGDSYYHQSLSVLKVGITGSIGVNFQIDNLILGIKSNYYYRSALLNKDFNTGTNFSGLSNPYKNITIRDCIFDLQFVIGYRFGKKDKESK